jgi:hypothetical protein
MGLIFRIVWFDDMNVLLKSYRFGRTSGDISQYIHASKTLCTGVYKSQVHK